MIKKILIFCCVILSNSIFLFAEKNKIYIYCDEGVGKTSLEQTVRSFKSNVPKTYEVKLINADGIINYTDWQNDAALIVIPGGADLPYAKKLNGKGNDNIKRYIKNGGNYLGICAGGYYGAKYIEFDKNGPLEVVGSRELSFFNGKAIGPILTKYDYKSNSGARAAKIKTKFTDIDELSVYYNGGSFFSYNLNKKIDIIAQYQSSKAKGLPAIIGMKYGKGTVILSGVHFEYDPNIMNHDDEYLKKILSNLLNSDSKRKILLKKIMEYFELID